MASCNKDHPSHHLLQLCVAMWLVFRWLDWTEAVHLQGSVKGRRHALLLPFFFPFSWNADMMAAAGAVILDNEVNLETKAWVAEEQVRRNEPGWTHDPWITAPALNCPPRHTHDGERDFCFASDTASLYFLSLTRNPILTIHWSVQSYAHHPREDTCVSGEDGKKEWFWGSTNTSL